MNIFAIVLIGVTLLAAPQTFSPDADGFIRYKHFGEGAYDETEKKILELLKEKEEIPN